MAEVAPPPVDDIKQPTAIYQQETDSTQSEPLDLSAKGKPQKAVARKKKETRMSETTSTVYGFIRVKRRADEDPASKILVSFKRQRVIEKQDDEKAETTTEVFEKVEKVLSFAGSVESHDHETINSFLEQFDANNAKAPSRSTKFKRNVKELRQLFTPASELLHQQRRQEIQSQTKISRCKIVSAHRGLDPEALIGSSGPKPLAKYSMYDLIHHAEESEEISKILPKADEVITVNGIPMVPVGDERPAEPRRDAGGKGGGMTTYVYDLYALPTPIETEDAVNVERSWDDKDLYFDDGEDEDEDADHPYEDEEDSNAEDNPNNDYPDEPEDDDDERDIEEADQDNAAGYYDENDVSDDDGNVAGWVNGSKGMKELAKHMNTLKLGHTGMDAIYYNDDEEPEDEFDADALKEVDDDDIEEEDYDY